MRDKYQNFSSPTYCGILKKILRSAQTQEDTMCCQSNFCSVISGTQRLFSDSVMKKRETLDPICQTIIVISLAIFATCIFNSCFNCMSVNYMRWVISISSIPFICATHIVFTIRRADKTNKELDLVSISKNLKGNLAAQ